MVGFFGWYVDESLDPILAAEQEFDFELCERLTAYVDLVTDISDADAAVVVARAFSIPGVADIELNLFDPVPLKGCEDLAGAGDFDSGAPLPAGEATDVAFAPEFDPCFVLETSSMVIYRGDPNLASQRALADALCGLPGVLSISSFDEAIFELDPYADCQTLYLDVRFAADVSDANRQGVRDFLTSSDVVIDVISFDDFFDQEPGFERRLPEIVVGEIDVVMCDPELAWELGRTMSARLTRIDEQAARSLADELLAMPGVVDVLGNAVRRSSEVVGAVDECGIDFMWFWFTPDAAAAERAAVLGVFAARFDVLAVALLEENDHVGTGSGTVDIGWSGTVTFTSEEPPADLDNLIAQIQSMPGVAYAEAIFGEHGDVFEYVEGEGEDTP